MSDKVDGRASHVTKQSSDVTEAPRTELGLRDISTAPKDRPILAYCNHEADPWEGQPTTDGRSTLTLYAAHAEGLSHAPTGFHIVEWGGAFDDSSWEYPNESCLPDWWFVAGSEFEVAANPTHWMPLPDAPLSTDPSVAEKSALSTSCLNLPIFLSAKGGE